MLLDVFGGGVDAHIRQPGALEVESAKLFAVHLEWALVPVAFDSLPRLGGFFAAPLRVVKDLASRRLNRLDEAHREHQQRAYPFPGCRVHSYGNYAIIP